VFVDESGVPKPIGPRFGVDLEAVMNKPAPKEPSMDEILSSIRQIIADDDAGAAPRKPIVPPAASLQAAPAPTPRPIPNLPPMTRQPEPEPDPEPLELTTDQMVVEEQEEKTAPGLSFEAMLGRQAREPAAPTGPPPLVDPEDITFEPDEAEMKAPAPSPPPVVRAPVLPPPLTVAPPPPLTPRPIPSVAQVAPMPDPTLSQDMAEQLLEPTTDAAVKHTFTRLQGVSMAGSSVTLEGLMREMLRPMLKEWLDENLPAVVERMVEKEIARISRGGE
jgi:uncharacterized protein